MADTTLKPWSQIVHLHSDVEAGDTAIATYAIDLGALVAGDTQVPKVYRDAHAFFAATYLTGRLRRLLEDVLRGLAEGKGDRVLQLRSPFGGGKSHTLAALYHLAHHPELIGDLPDCANSVRLKPVRSVRVAVFDGEKFDVRGRVIDGQPVQTMWGMLAAQLGCYDVVAHHDATRGAPGGDVIAQMLGDQPTLLLLDEVLKYLERASAEPVLDSTLGRQVQDFLQSLSVEVARAHHAVMVYSLQASVREALGNQATLDMLDHLTSRVDAKREPVTGDEILPVLRRRLLDQDPDPAAATAAAATFATTITSARMSHTLDEAGRRAAADDRLALHRRIEAAYPFHPALIDIMTERWASLPDFQRTRGALRFLSVCLYTLKRDDQARIVLGPGDIPIEDEDVQHAFFTEVGQREPFMAVLQRDFLGPNARVKRIDERLGREHPALSNVHPAQRIATAILAYSFGGLTRQDEAGGEPIATGVAESELLSSVVSPDLDSITAQAVLKELREQCLFLHYDGVHYVFKTTPNVTQILEAEAQNPSVSEGIDAAIRSELDKRLSGRKGAIIWPAHSEKIPHKEPRFLLAYLPLDFAQHGPGQQERLALELCMQYGDIPRQYRNGIGLAIPERRQVEQLRSAARYLEAIKRVRAKRQQYNLTTPQMQQLKEREGTENTRFESALRQLYETVWLPQTGRQGLTGQSALILEKLTLTGRPTAASGIHERLMELLTDIAHKVFVSLTADKIVTLMQLGAGSNASLAVNLGQVLDSFYEVLDFPRLADENVLRQAVTAGVEAGVFGYVGRPGQIEVGRAREGGHYFVRPELVQIGVAPPETQIDLREGVLVLPAAIQAGAPAPEVVDTTTGAVQPSAVTVVPPATEVPVVAPEPEPGSPSPPARTVVHLEMTVVPQQLYHLTSPLMNLARESGHLRLVVEAHKAAGFDPQWLQNAVFEPLDEADIDVTE
ncbi:MAG: DUF499 domain-containing protein [Anaerolineae bacterium]|nr:DUF499 domain-containing protein [Anaerolineae bacterium]